MLAKAEISGLILAGGAGRRVARRDKGLIEWRGKPLIWHVSNCLAHQVGQLIISCNRNTETYRQYASTIVSDTRNDYQGPLAGLEGAVPKILGKVLVVVACDTPQLPNDLVGRLVAPLADTAAQTAQISYVFDGHRNQYLCAAIRRECLTSLPGFLDGGERAVKHWYKGFRTLSVDFSDQQECFSNYNRID